MSVYHLLFTFILAEFMTACLQSNANTKGIRTSGFHGVIYFKFKTKSILPGAFLFFPSSSCRSVNSNAMYSVPLQCLLGWPPSALAPTHVALPWLWPVRMHLSTSHGSSLSTVGDKAPLLSNQSWCANAASENQSMCISHDLPSLPTSPLPLGLSKD